MKKYENIISLGFFCSVASELERLGLRSVSSPFDWILSDFEELMNCMKDDFSDFLKTENLLQYESNPSYYYDEFYKMHFYHDFKPDTPLKYQIDLVSKKYAKRIERFKLDITKPTLFLRYIENQAEADYISRNFNEIKIFLTKGNKNNDVIFISNDDINASFELFEVEKDENDTVSRMFVNNNKELEYLLKSQIIDVRKRKENKKKYYIKKLKKKKKSFLSKFKLKKDSPRSVYYHPKIYSENCHGTK